MHRQDCLKTLAEKAEQMVWEELGKLSWGVEDLAGRPKGDARRVKIAARLRRETTMTLEWIAERLGGGAATHVATLLQRDQRREAKSEESLF